MSRRAARGSGSRRYARATTLIASVADTIANHKQLFVDLLYGDQEGGQRTISRFMISQHPSEPEEWLPGVVRHWYLDRQNPR